jgi:hypothetical protein
VLGFTPTFGQNGVATLAINVPSARYGEIYNIILDDKRYNVTIKNFPKCSCVYFVTMLVCSLGGRGVYVQCEHVYHVL